MNPATTRDETRQVHSVHFEEVEDDGNQIAVIAARCPICNSRLVNGLCGQHGRICETCGTIYRDPFCPNCYALVSSQLGGVNYFETNSRERRNPKTFRLGELGIAAKDFAAITGRQSLTKKESNILRAANSEESIKKKIGQKAESAVRWLNLPRNLELELIESVERRASSVISRYRREAPTAGRKNRLSAEKVVEYSFLIEAKKIGRTILEVQEALARAGFNVKLQLFTVRITVPRGRDISSVRMYLNEWKKEPGSFRMKELGDGPIGREYVVTVQSLLSDTIDQRGRIGRRSWIKVRFENAVLIPGSVSPTSTINKPNEERGIRFDKKDPRVVWLKLNAEKCFALFTDMNRFMELGTNFEEEKIVSPNPAEIIEASIRQHLPLPSKKFPASAALMQRASCLSNVERRSVELFRESLKNSGGRSQKSLARAALLRADQEVFSSLSTPVKLAMRAYVSTLPFERRDRLYTGVKGLLLLSEIM